MSRPLRLSPSRFSPLRLSILGFLFLCVTLTLMRMRNLILDQERRRPWVLELVKMRGQK